MFTLLCGASKSFMKALKAFIKTFEALQRSVKIKIQKFRKFFVFSTWARSIARGPSSLQVRCDDRGQYSRFRLKKKQLLPYLLPDMLNTYQREIKLFELSQDTNIKELKVRKN